VYARAPTRAEVAQLAPRVRACCAAAATATGCDAAYSVPSPATHDLRQNAALADTFARVFRKHYGPIDHEWGIKSASTDFGNVTYALPSIHPGFSIPTEPNGGNHTVAFTRAVATPAAHAACVRVAQALAVTGARVLADDVYFAEVQRAFREDQEIVRGAH